jgi:hypothetical protein
MLIAYVLEHVLGLMIVLAYSISIGLQHKQTSHIFRRSLEVFHDCATFLTFSIQIAAIVVLVKVDFGLGTANMGDATVRITQAVSALTLLPLTYVMVLLHHTSDADVGFELPAEHVSSNRPTRETAKRFGLFVLCWLLSLYPFYSKMNSVFGPSKIGPVISHEQFAAIEKICYQGVRVVSDAEDRFMTAVAIIAFIPLSLLACGRVVVLGVRKHHAQSRIYLRVAMALQSERVARRFRQALVLSLGLIPLLACGLLWTVVRDQNFQKEMTAAAGNDFADGQWTFGQVVAVTVFVPVLVEAWCLFGEQREQERLSVRSMRDVFVCV